MTPLALAKRRSLRRKDSAGAIMFIIAITMAVLAAVGMFALRASSYEVRTSGYERQNAQTHYLAEYGMLTAATEINTGSAQGYVDIMTGIGATRDTNCISLAPVFSIAGPVTTPSLQSRACRREGSGELTAGWKNGLLSGGNTANVNILDGWSKTKPGSLGSAPMDGDYFVELTDPIAGVLVTGTDLSQGRCFFEITVTSVGVTTPSRSAPLIIADSSNPDTGLFGNEGLEAQRARFVVGPVTSNACASRH